MIRLTIDKMLSKRGKTKYWLSHQTGITQTNLGKLVNHQTNSIKFDNLERICEVLECDISDILEIVKEDNEEKVEE